MKNMESANGNGTGNRTRLIKIEDVLMVLLTIITCSKKLDSLHSHQFASYLWSLFLKGEWNLHGALSWKITKKGIEVISILEFHVFTWKMLPLFKIFVCRSWQSEESIDWNVTEYTLKFKLVMPWILVWPFGLAHSTSKYCFPLDMHFAFKCILTLADREC